MSQKAQDDEKHESPKDEKSNTGTKNKKWELYGRASQKVPQSLRWVCRERFNDIPPVLVLESLKDTQADLQQILHESKQLGLETGFMERDLRMLDDVDAGEVKRRLDEAYRERYDVGHCPFQERGTKKACWGCNVPKETMEKLREGYD